ncbi:methyl-accepting chemotaxis protein [Undibacterium sp.]|jgi:methyl-accepting chemotaxis protein|uniref:methyl-accepting chemotaxis protein n=1 Tax=Undibacterium sp. TaxID=1914977 RepID=UPI002BFBE6A1|nr:methyl-accepting chemotaxis protein [Undibacterium sp.]HTD06641.1 methyl-accepting chemotaxis protein [Undibacterium sp.]
MNWFAHLKVSTKLIGGFLIVAAIGASIGIQGILKAGEINNMATIMYERETIGLRYISDANAQMIAAARAIRSAILASTEEARANSLKDMEQRLENTRSGLDKSEKVFVTQDGKAKLAAAGAALQAYSASIKEVANLLKDEPLGEVRGATSKLAEVRHFTEKAEELMGKLVEQKQANADRLNIETDRIYVQIIVLLTSLTVGGVLVGIAIGILISRNITRQLGGEPADVANIAGTIAAGDLTGHIDTSRARAGSIVDAMHGMQESLRTMVGTVRASSDGIAASSSQIAAGNIDLSSRTEEQASSLEETAASMEELTSTVKQNADNARQANAMAVTASNVAVKGGEVVLQVVETMGSINDSAKKIVDIIGVIDGIAFQTNILALNAAVEAARAGEQGRGFAVVATEVRTLAQRSAAAAKEIKALIDDSVEKVDIGTRLVDQAGATMKEIVESVKRVTDTVNEITAASQEQSTGIEQVNQAISQMDEVTQQNSALVEEAAAAAESLRSQAGNLAQVVSVFKLDAAHRTTGLHAANDSRLASSGETPIPRKASASVMPLARKMAPPQIATAPSALRKKSSGAGTRPAAEEEWEQF